MASRLTSYWRSMISGMARNKKFVTSTTPKMNAYAPTADKYADAELLKPGSISNRRVNVNGEYVPVYVALGMIMLSAGLGLYTAKQQLLYSPSVRVNKKRRETLPEVVEPDRVAYEAYNLITKSLFRNVAHIAEEFVQDTVIPDPIRGDVLSELPLKAVTLKSVGVRGDDHPSVN